MSCMLLSAVGTVVSVLVAVAAVAVVVLTVVLHAVRKKQGKGGCGCDYAGPAAGGRASLNIHVR